MKTPRHMLVAALMLAASAAHAADEPWRSVTRQCDEVAESTFCAGKAGCPNWEWLAGCTAQNYFPGLSLTPAQTDHIRARYPSCVAGTRARRMRAGQSAGHGDPVAEVFGCLLAQ